MAESPSVKQGTPPKSILILGSGVFGLSTAYALTQRAEFDNTEITLVDRLPFPAPDAASIDSSRIVRADYADIAYSSLAFEAQERWRNEWWGADGIYHETGLAVVVNARESNDGNGELGREYMRKSMANVTKLGLKSGRREDGGEVEALDSPADVRRIFNDGTRAARAQGAQDTQQQQHSTAGDFGYVNWRSGWAHAENGMRALRRKAESTNRITFVHATVRRLHYTDNSVRSVELSNGSTLAADLVVLATGAWTPALVDTRGICSATGQILTYLPLTAAEQAQLENNPTLLNESSGLFIIPPRDRVLKVARHGYGYANPTRIPHPEKPAASGEMITVSLPKTHVSDPGLQLPDEGTRACRQFLATVLPSLKDREFSSGRICWYTDTARGDWIVDYHPKYANLFVATGGSGHAYKFLPVVGDKIVDSLMGNTPAAFKEKWAWPKERTLEDQVWTVDWRGGVKGMILNEELGKAKQAKL